MKRIFKQRLKKALQRPQSDMEPEAMESLGINNIMRAAKIYNRSRYGALQTERESALANGAAANLPAPKIKMRDGWAVDESRTLPHLDQLLTEAETVIAQRGGSHEYISQRGFMRDLLKADDLEKCPSFLNFVLSEEVLSTVCDYLGYAPVFSDLVPPGVRFAESNAALDPTPNRPPRQSQLYHLDFHDRPLVYVLVLLRDVTIDSGPFTFFGAEASQKISKAVRYGARKRPFRLSDEEVYAAADKKDEHQFMYPRGTVLFIDSSRCFHFGSRNAVVPRYQMMYAFVSACRTDFSEKFMPRREYPVSENDSFLRRYALNSRYSEKSTPAK